MTTCALQVDITNAVLRLLRFFFGAEIFVILTAFGVKFLALALVQSLMWKERGNYICK